MTEHRKRVVPVSDPLPHSESLQTRYKEKLAADLQSNSEDHQLVTARVAELQEQLTVLERDRELLLNLQAAISTKTAPGQPEQDLPGAPLPVHDSEVSSPVADDTPDTKPAAKHGGAAEKPARARRGKPAPSGKQESESGTDSAGKSPTLIDVVDDYLRQQTGPRTAAEVAEGASTPGRPVDAGQARAALEGLVSRSAANRARQGRTVYYETTAGRPATGEEPNRPEVALPEAAQPADAPPEEGTSPDTEHTPSSEPLSSDRVLAALRELGGAQTARGIAEHLYEAAVDNPTTNRVRTTLTRLVEKALAVKSTQDSKVVYEAKAS
ncbi:MAG: hypothetical protein JWL99_6386 [Streptomyces oryziradicis]|jgi:hypothetical protein|nr:hypothetical protein [Actinacidiphila oryziradicis]